MPSYDPTVWENETPQTTPIKYKITDDTEGVLANSAKIELVTPVTPGTPLDATRMNKIEQGIEAVTDSDAQGIHRNAANELASVTDGTFALDNDLVLLERPSSAGAKRVVQAVNLVPSYWRCKVTRTTAQSIPNATATPITFQTAVFQTPTNIMWAGGSAVNIVADGVYLVVASVAFNASTTGNLRSVRIYKNGADGLARYDSSPIGGGGGTFVQASCIDMLNADDTITMVVWQDSGGALDAIAAFGAPSLTVVRLA